MNELSLSFVDWLDSIAIFNTSILVELLHDEVISEDGAMCRAEGVDADG